MKNYILNTVVYLSLFLSEIDCFLVTCYYNSPALTRAPPWNYKVSDVPFNTCDYLMYSFVGLNNRTFEVEILDYKRDVIDGGFREAVAYKNNSRSTLVLIALGGWGEGVKKYSDMVSTEYTRAIFVRSVVEFITKYCFDGLDLDWEYPADVMRGGRYADKENFIRLLTDLRYEFDLRGWKLTSAVGVFQGIIDNGYDCPRMGMLLDLVNVMNYDMRGDWSKSADNHSPLYRRPFDQGRFKLLNTHDVMNLWINCGFPRHKLVMGLPFYAKTFTLADPSNWKPNAPIKGKGRITPITNETGAMSFYDICTFRNRPDCQYHFDAIGRVPYLVCGDLWIGYDDESSIREKTSYALSQGYGGVMMWSIDQDDLWGGCGMGKNPLMDSIMSVISRPT